MVLEEGNLILHSGDLNGLMLFHQNKDYLAVCLNLYPRGNCCFHTKTIVSVFSTEKCEYIVFLSIFLR